MAWFDGAAGSWPRIRLNLPVGAAGATLDAGGNIRSLHRSGPGRDSWIDTCDPAGLTVTLNNPAGTYDPTHNAFMDVGIAVDLDAILGANTYPLFTGTMRRIRVDAGLDPTVTFEAADGLEDLGRATLATEPTPILDGQWSGDRIDELADRAGWAGGRAIDTGHSRVQPTLLGATAADLINQVALTELGLCFVDPDGTLTFHDRHRHAFRARSTAVQLTISDLTTATHVGMAELTIERDTDGVYNDVHLTRDAVPGAPTEPDEVADDLDVPVEQSATDSASVATYGALNAPAELGRLHVSDPEVKGMCEYLVDRFADPGNHIREVTINALHPKITSEGLWGALLGLGPLDRIRVRRDYGPGALDVELLIHKVASLEINADPLAFNLTLTTTEAPPTPTLLIIGTDQVGDNLGW
jgi:hypothetical protein